MDTKERLEDLSLCYEKMSKLADKVKDKKISNEIKDFAQLYKEELIEIFDARNKTIDLKESKDLKVIEGGYNIFGKMLFFDTNEGRITMDLRSALEVAGALFECVGLEYDEGNLQQVEDIIAEREGI